MYCFYQRTDYGAVKKEQTYGQTQSRDTRKDRRSAQGAQEERRRAREHRRSCKGRGQDALGRPGVSRKAAQSADRFTQLRRIPREGGRVWEARVASGAEMSDEIQPKRNGTPEERRLYFRLQRARWRANNPERARAANQSWRLANLEKARAQSRAANKRYSSSDKGKQTLKAAAAAYGKKNRARIREYQREWQKNNRDKTKAYVNKYDERNRDKRREAALKYRQENPESSRAATRKWKENNLDKLLARRRGGVRGVAYQQKIIARMNFFGACAYCRGAIEHIDHAIAIARGGTNWPANLRPSCRQCNIRKGAKDWRKWRVLL